MIVLGFVTKKYFYDTFSDNFPVPDIATGPFHIIYWDQFGELNEKDLDIFGDCWRSIQCHVGLLFNQIVSL
jgi:hypothetical protein